jgi:hypothetical protein
MPGTWVDMTYKWYGKAIVGSNIEFGNLGRKKAAAVNRIGAVSPAARSNPRITPVMIPGKDCGMTIFRMVCQRVAPTEMLTTLNSCGTALKASSAVLMITGSVIIDRVKDPARILVPNLRKITNIPNPNSPYTTDGIPAKFIIAIRIALVQRLSGAYSDRYIAAPIPNGTEKMAVPIVSKTVPTIAG